jgi:hypothetical protein
MCDTDDDNDGHEIMINNARLDERSWTPQENTENLFRLELLGTYRQNKRITVSKRPYRAGTNSCIISLP